MKLIYKEHKTLPSSENFDGASLQNDDFALVQDRSSIDNYHVNSISHDFFINSAKFDEDDSSFATEIDLLQECSLVAKPDYSKALDLETKNISKENNSSILTTNTQKSSQYVY